MSPGRLETINRPDIIDIRSDGREFSIINALKDGLNPSNGGPKKFPTFLLYDTKGLRLFEEITYLDDYYLTNTEIEVLQAHAKSIVQWMPHESQLIELGSGNLRKIEIVLKEFENQGRNVDYYALDLSLEELQRTFAEVSPQMYQHVRFHGLHGTYDDGLLWLQNPENRRKATCVLSMGSSMGNFTHSEVPEFLGQFARILSPGDSMIIALDACHDKQKVFSAYNDSKGITRQFYRNGLAHANQILGYEAFKDADWEIETVYDEVGARHRAFYVPTRDLSIENIDLSKGDKILLEEAWKYGPREQEQLWRKAGLVPLASYRNRTDDYHIRILSPGQLDLPRRVKQYAPHPIPKVEEWKSLWTAWDIVTKSMTPQDSLLSKPIKLRNALIFYLGHIPTFLDMHLTRATKAQPTPPVHYPAIFERGVDPDVENPEVCHAHSAIPDEYPPLREILDYQDKVRHRLMSVLENEQLEQDRLLAEAVWIGFEHETLHLETFLYMLLQSDQTLPPPGLEAPDFERLALEARNTAVPNEWFTIPSATFTVGLKDDDLSKLPELSFGWDNEKPQRAVSVSSFSAKGRPITNGEYAAYLKSHNLLEVPASWVTVTKDLESKKEQQSATTNGHGQIDGTDSFISKYAVRTVLGNVPLRWALDWPVMASFDELERYAKWQRCRLPTYEEVQSIYKYAESLKTDGVLHVINGEKNVSNGSSNGVDYERNPARPRAPDHQPVQLASAKSVPVFRDLDGCNVGFKHWHPVPVTSAGDRLAGQGELGGVWEWTSTPFMRHEGFEAMEIYPGYSADFFDGKHNIVLGGSWATHPRVAGRTTFINWYQHNYPYTWAGARLVRDI